MWWTPPDQRAPPIWIEHTTEAVRVTVAKAWLAHYTRLATPIQTYVNQVWWQAWLETGPLIAARDRLVGFEWHKWERAVRSKGVLAYDLADVTADGFDWSRRVREVTRMRAQEAMHRQIAQNCLVSLRRGAQIYREAISRMTRLAWERTVEPQIEANRLHQTIHTVELELWSAINSPVQGGVDPTLWLPDELLIMIFRRLPLDLLNGSVCQRVCRRWANVARCVTHKLRSGLRVRMESC